MRPLSDSIASRVALITLSLTCMSSACAQTAAAKSNMPAPSTIGVVTSLSAGDTACYLEFIRDDGKSLSEMADFPVCEQDLLGRRVEFFYAMEKVRAPSCRGNPDCKNILKKMLIVEARVVDPKATADARYRTLEKLSPFLIKLDAAEKGDASAQFDVGSLYEAGREVAQDYHLAWKWIKAAADQNHVKAQSTIGRFYSQGKGVSVDLVKAHVWTQVAATRGSSVAAGNLPKVAARMNAEQLTEAEQQFAQCKEKSFVACD